MIVRRVTRVWLTGTTDLVSGDTPWRVEWTKMSDTGKETHLRQSPYTEESARRPARNLVEGRRDGLAVEDVYSEAVSGSACR